MNNNTKVHLTLQKEGGRLISSAQYSDAVVTVKNRYTKDEKVTILVPSKLIKARVEKHATINKVLGKEFIDNCLSEPTYAFGKSKSRIKAWKKLPDWKRIKIHCEDLAHDMDAIILHVEIN